MVLWPFERLRNAVYVLETSRIGRTLSFLLVVVMWVCHFFSNGHIKELKIEPGNWEDGALGIWQLAYLAALLLGTPYALMCLSGGIWTGWNKVTYVNNVRCGTEMIEDTGFRILIRGLVILFTVHTVVAFPFLLYYRHGLFAEGLSFPLSD